MEGPAESQAAHPSQAAFFLSSGPLLGATGGDTGVWRIAVKRYTKQSTLEQAWFIS